MRCKMRRGLVADLLLGELSGTAATYARTSSQNVKQGLGGLERYLLGAHSEGKGLPAFPSHLSRMAFLRIVIQVLTLPKETMSVL